MTVTWGLPRYRRRHRRELGVIGCPSTAHYRAQRRSFVGASG